MVRVSSPVSPAVLALVGWLYIFASPAFEPGGWKFMVYAFATIGAGIAGYFILAYKNRMWPIAGRRPT